MSWFAVDDRFHHHRKVIRLRRHGPAYPAALALWTLTGSWAAGDESAKDTGAVPVDVVASFGVPGWQSGLDALVGVGLWSCDGECVAFHDWSFWNGPDAKARRIEARQASDRDRQKRARDRRKATPEPVSRDGHVTRGTGRDGTGTNHPPSHNATTRNDDNDNDEGLTA